MSSSRGHFNSYSFARNSVLATLFHEQTHLVFGTRGRTSPDLKKYKGQKYGSIKILDSTIWTVGNQIPEPVFNSPRIIEIDQLFQIDHLEH
jgi:hypothetical protein